jgi:hypothetical protein
MVKTQDKAPRISLKSIANSQYQSASQPQFQGKSLGITAMASSPCRSIGIAIGFSWKARHVADFTCGGTPRKRMRRGFCTSMRVLTNATLRKVPSTEISI